MADVTIKYKDNVIAEMNESDTKTLNTSGCYCEGNIVVDYTPSNKGGNSKTYEITLPKSTDWILLTTLDDEVLEHINDPYLIVTLINISEYEYDQYSKRAMYSTNTPIGMQGNKYPVYGNTTQQSNETAVGNSSIYYPPNKTDTSVSIGGSGAFRVEEGKYYATGFSAGIQAGTWLLRFSW